VLNSPYLLAKVQNSEPLNIILNPFQLYTIPLADWINTALNFIVQNFRPVFQIIRYPFNLVLDRIEFIFLSVPPLIFLIAIGLIIWQVAGHKVAIYSVVVLTLLGFLGVWEQTMATLVLVVTGVVFCTVVGIPVGIACAQNDRLDRFVLPILDTMQTIPLFIYLVPVVMLFGIGKIPAVIAIFVVAIPPLIRLTSLGIRQVSPSTVEAAQAFGSSPWQVLWEVLLPLAMPSILLGMNQTILFALGMSAVASMIGVEGLGLKVLDGLARLDIGLAAIGGLGFVLLAIMLDQIVQAMISTIKSGSWHQRGPIGLLLFHLPNKKQQK
jgi:glycine betaine/proline transport system permease protein